MTVSQLACFLAVTECSSFTKAAERLYISHSAVSKAVSSLEDSLGTRLLIRDNRTVTITPAGELLREQGTQLLESWKSLEEQVSYTGNLSRGTVSIYTPHLFTLNQFPVYSRMKEEYPLIELDIHLNDPVTIYPIVKNADVNVGITFSYFVPPDDQSIARLPLFEDYFRAVVYPSHPFASLHSVTISQVLNEPLIIPLPNGPDYEPDIIMSKITRPPQSKDYQAKDLDECLFHVALGKGVAILPGMSVEAQNSICKCIPISDLPDSFSLLMIWKKDNLSVPLRCFLSLVGAIDKNKKSR